MQGQGNFFCPQMRVHGFGVEESRVEGLGFRVQGFRVEELRVEDFGVRVWGLGFRV